MRNVLGPSDPMVAFIASLVVEGRACLVVGGDAEAAEKSARLAAAGARVTLIAPEVIPAIEALHREGTIRWEARAFDGPKDLATRPFVVISTVPDEAFSAALHAQAREVGAVVCCVDRPAHCDFFHTAQGPIGELTLAVASGGRAPALARRLRDDLIAGLDAPVRALSAAVVALREQTPRHERRARMAEALKDVRVEVRVHLPPWLRAGS